MSDKIIKENNAKNRNTEYLMQSYYIQDIAAARQHGKSVHRLY